MVKSINTPSGIISYELTRKDIKNINLRVKSNGKIKVSCPMRSSDGKVDNFVISRHEWITNALDRQSVKAYNMPKFNYDDGDILYYLGDEYTLRVVENDRNFISSKQGELTVNIKDKRDKNMVAMGILKWYTKQANELLPMLFFQESTKYADMFGSDFDLRLSDNKSRWGSCTPSLRKIMLSRRLIFFDIDSINAVIKHELAHMSECNHGASFYGVLEKISPNYKQYKNRLKQANICSVLAVIFSKKTI